MSENNVTMNHKILPAVALRGMSILPGAIIHFDLNRPKSISAVEQAMISGGQIFLVTQRNQEDNDPAYEQMYHVGIIAQVKQITKLPNRIIRVLVEGISRGMFLETEEEHDRFLEAKVMEVRTEDEKDISESEENRAETAARLRQLKEYFAAYAAFYPKLGQNALKRYADIQDLGSLIDQIAMNMPVDYTVRQQVLEAVPVSERYEVICEILLNEIEIAKIKTELSQKIKGRVEKNQKEYLLREQLHYIKEELGEEGSFSDADQFEEELEKLQASEEIKAKIKKEIVRFKGLAPSSSEGAVERAYIETLLELPWDKRLSIMKV